MDCGSGPKSCRIFLSAFQLSQQAAHIAIHIGIALAQVFDKANGMDDGGVIADG